MFEVLPGGCHLFAASAACLSLVNAQQDGPLASGEPHLFGAAAGIAQTFVDHLEPRIDVGVSLPLTPIKRGLPFYY